MKTNGYLTEVSGNVTPPANKNTDLPFSVEEAL
jgi:hypothetical protein